jgi:PAS domain S-box-containing protein
LKYQVNVLSGRSTPMQVILPALIISIGLYFLRSYNYLLYHSMIELFAAVVAFTIFSIGWHTRKYSQTNILILLAVGYLLVGITDVLHILAFKGMGVFTGYDANLPTQLWIAGRYLEALTILSGAYYLGRKKLLSAPYLLALALIFATAMITAIFTGYFPDCFVEGQGLTVFKIASEYIISLLLLLAAVIFYRKRNHLSPNILKLLLAAIILTVLSEMSFTLYVDVYGFFNYLGHIFKLFSVMLIYKALIEESLNNPFQLLFKELSESKNQLQADLEKITAAEEALKARERFLDTTLQTTIDGFWVVDNQKRITMVNDAYCAMSGYSREELLNMTIKDLDALEEPEETAARIKRIVENGSEMFQTCHRRKDGSIFPLEISITYLPEKGGKMLCFCRDITERKEAEKALRLQASERAAVDAFTSSVSHDLQAPLRRIEGFSEALLEECQCELSEKARDYLKRIIRQIELMHERTDALLKLSSVVSHGIVHEEVNLSGLARSYLEKLRYAEPNRQVETVVAPDLVARGDVKLLSIFLENLLENAWKFSVNVEKACIECGSLLKDGRTVYFVKDNGAGFDQQHAAEIFDPFKKLHNEVDYPGIGIGLNIAYRIIIRHGGEIWAEGETGKGACFYFTLP